MDIEKLQELSKMNSYAVKEPSLAVACQLFEWFSCTAWLIYSHFIQIQMIFFAYSITRRSDSLQPWTKETDYDPDNGGIQNLEERVADIGAASHSFISLIEKSEFDQLCRKILLDMLGIMTRTIAKIREKLYGIRRTCEQFDGFANNSWHFQKNSSISRKYVVAYWMPFAPIESLCPVDMLPKRILLIPVALKSSACLAFPVRPTCGTSCKKNVHRSLANIYFCYIRRHQRGSVSIKHYFASSW